MRHHDTILSTSTEEYKITGESWNFDTEKLLGSGQRTLVAEAVSGDRTQPALSTPSAVVVGENASINADAHLIATQLAGSSAPLDASSIASAQQPGPNMPQLAAH